MFQNELGFRIWDLLKTSTPESPQREIVLSGYPPSRRLCIVTYVKTYLERTAPLRKGQTKLLPSFRAPHSVSRHTIRRWMKTVLEQAGIDSNICTPHSTQVASTSKVVGKIPFKTLLQTAEWRRRSTFETYYHQPVSKDALFHLQSCREVGFFLVFFLHIVSVWLLNVYCFKVLI